MRSLLFLSFLLSVASADKPNILFISVDDMNTDSVGVYGNPLRNITPHMDQLAAEGMRFEFAHVMVGNCYPGRNVMFSGRSSHSNLVEGFYAINEPHYPHLVDLMKEEAISQESSGKRPIRLLIIRMDGTWKWRKASGRKITSRTREHTTE